MPDNAFAPAVPDEPLEGLTAKQWQFVQAVHSGMSYLAAYKQVYDCKELSDRAIRSGASVVSTTPAVIAKLAAMRRAVEERTTLAPLVSKDFVLQGITSIALNGDKDSTRLRAFELLGKTVGIDLFRETVVHERTERTVADIERELKAKLASLKSTIEGTSRPIDPPAPSPGRKRKPRV